MLESLVPTELYSSSAEEHLPSLWEALGFSPAPQTVPLRPDSHQYSPCIQSAGQVCDTVTVEAAITAVWSRAVRHPCEELPVPAPTSALLSQNYLFWTSVVELHTVALLRAHTLPLP